MAREITWGMRRALLRAYDTVARWRSGRKHPMAAKENKQIFIAPGEGVHLPLLDMVHKITADRSRSRSEASPQGE
jgi:hypothetical protein